MSIDIINFNEDEIFESRYQGIFSNPNEFSILMVIGFALILFTETKTPKNYID